MTQRAVYTMLITADRDLNHIQPTQLDPLPPLLPDPDGLLVQGGRSVPA